MKLSLFLLAALLLQTPSAMASKWRTLQSNSSMTLEADEPESMASEDNGQNPAKKKVHKLKVWGKITYARPQQAKPGDFFYAISKSLLAINCTKRSYKLLKEIYYAADDNAIKYIDYGEGEKSEVIVPDSVEERISDFSCPFKAEKPAIKPVPRPQEKAAAP